MEYIIEHGDNQFYIDLGNNIDPPYGYIDTDGVITVHLGQGSYRDALLTFEDEVRVLEQETRKVIFNSEDEIWEDFR